MDVCLPPPTPTIPSVLARLAVWSKCRIVLLLMAVVPSPVQHDSDRPKTSMFLSYIVLRRVVSLSLCVPRVPRERTFQGAMVVLPLALNAALGCFGCL